MKPTTAIKKFPGLPIRHNCIMDLLCPECGQRDSLTLEVKCRVPLDDDGTDPMRLLSGHDWDSRSWTECPECGTGGSMGKFCCPGLDQALEDAERN